MIIHKIKFPASCLVLLLSIVGQGQSSDDFVITQSVIAAGGGKTDVGGNFALESTSGQSFAGTNSSSGGFNVSNGFWTLQLAPTAAGTLITGRVKTESGKGIRNARLTLTNAASGEVFHALSGIFGVYRFENVAVGQTYILTVSARRFTFAPSVQVVLPLDELTNIDFVGAETF